MAGGRPVATTRAAEGHLFAEVPPFEADGVLDDLTPAQRQAVTTPASSLCVLAGAGTGKTRVLTRRIAHQVGTGRAGAEHVLALTFTRKAAGELGSRLRALGLRDDITAGTFHGVASAQLHRWWADQGRRAPTLLTTPSRLLGPLAGQQSGLRGLPVGELVGLVAWAQARLVGPDRLEAVTAAERRALPGPADQLAVLLARYQDEKRRRGLVDFDDLLARCADALDEDARFARAARWRWRHVFVDEFQDVNPLQHRLLLAWLGSGADLSVVGDPNQAVYGWNGSDPGLLDAVPVRWPDTEVVHLDDNYRCSPQVVAAGVAVLGGSGNRLRSRCPDGPSPTVRAYPSDVAEAAGVVGGLRDAHASGLAWSRMAVLVRTNAQARPLRDALEAAGIPCRAPSNAGLLAHPTAVEAMDELRRQPGLPVAVAAVDLTTAAREAAGGGAAGGAAVLAVLSELARDFRRLDHRATVAGFLAWLPTAAGREPGDVGRADAVTISSFHRSKGLEWSAVWICGLERGLVPIGHATTTEALAEERRLLYVALTRAERELHCSWASRRTFGDHSVTRDPSPWLASVGGGLQTDGAPPPDDIDTWRSLLAQQRRQLRGEATWAGKGDTTPGDTTPGDTTPGDTTPGDTTPGDTTPGDTTPGNTTPGDTTPGNTTPGNTTPGNTTPGNTTRSGGGIAVLSDDDHSAPDVRIAGRLRAWRAERARAVGIPAHVVLQDRSVEALSKLRPASTAELLAVPGLGPVKVARLGSTLVSLVAGVPAA
jgi:DNA helicase II / ATP-dependent DNA helicase PcrA